MREKKDEIHPASCLVCNVHVIFLAIGFFIVALLVSWAPSALAIDDFNLDFKVYLDLAYANGLCDLL